MICPACKSEHYYFGTEGHNCAQPTCTYYVKGARVFGEPATTYNFHTKENAFDKIQDLAKRLVDTGLFEIIENTFFKSLNPDYPGKFPVFKYHDEEIWVSTYDNLDWFAAEPCAYDAKTERFNNGLGKVVTASDPFDAVVVYLWKSNQAQTSTKNVNGQQMSPANIPSSYSNIGANARPTTTP